MNAISAAPNPTRRFIIFKLVALEVLVLVSETNITKSVKYNEQILPKILQVIKNDCETYVSIYAWHASV
jgi:hypothetical protein